MTATTPRLSVIVRSYNRLPWLCELVETLLTQDHDAFEIVVVEQSTDAPPAAAARLRALEADPRLRVLSHRPLGGARARNVGVAASRGAVLVFIDDDDLPVGRAFLRAIEARFDADPRCLGLSVRQSWEDGEAMSRIYRARARRRCMRFSPLLKLPYTYVRHDAPVARVDYVHGTGGALRREVLARVGGWDEDTPIEDEVSIAYRLRPALRPGEYLTFFPGAHLRRRMDVGGGLAKRKATTAGFFRRYLTFVHHILGRYHRTRVLALYPLYVLAGWTYVMEWLWNDLRDQTTFARRLGGALGFTLAFPVLAARELWRARLGRRPGSGEALAVTVRAPAVVSGG